jgi:hypothetical protein
LRGLVQRRRLLRKSRLLCRISFEESELTGNSTIKWGYYIIFICLNALTAIAIWFVFPNTRGLALEEVAAIFGVSPLPRTEEAHVFFLPTCGKS